MLDSLRIAPPARIAAVVGASALLAVLGACAHDRSASAEQDPTATVPAAPRAAGYWTPEASPTFVSIDREQTMVVSANHGREMLVLVTDGETATGKPGGRYTWIVSLPRDADLERPLRVGEDDVQAWVHERWNGARRVLPARGSVTLRTRGADLVTASLALSPEIGEYPGAAHAPPLFMEAACEHTAPPVVVATAPLGTAGGTNNRPQKPEPDRRPVDPVWPWGEIVGDHPRPMPKN